jgi:protein-L-isoaspartate(D-aspartate) O-methyltransferase
VGDDDFEFGASGHGPHGVGLAERVVEQVRLWDRDHRHSAPASITVYPASVALAPLSGERVIRKRHTTVTIRWP